MRRVFGMVSTQASLDYTAAALATFFQYTPLGPQDEFYLIDNDQSANLAALKAAFPRVIPVVNIRPFSYAENANQVIALAARAGADAYIMNNDIIFTPGWLAPLDAELPVILAPTSNQNFQYTLRGLQIKTEMALQDYKGHERELLEIVAAHCRQHARYTTAYQTNFFLVKIPVCLYNTVGQFDPVFTRAGGEDIDYCIRAYLKGFSLFVAQHSYLLHFGGRATWSGPETRDEWRARESNAIALLAGKWGPLLTKFLVYRDPSVIAGDPALDKIQVETGIGGLYQELARRGGVAIPKDLLWQPRIAAVYCLCDDPRWLRLSLQSVYAACDRIFCLVQDEADGSADVLQKIADTPDPAKKITVIRGRWPDGAAQRNAALDLLQAEGFDYCLAMDCDEIYDPAQLQALLRYAAARRYRAAWQVQRVTYWKSCRFRIAPPEDLKPAVLVRVGALRIGEQRRVDTSDIELIPAGIATCHHLAYVASDQEMQRRIETFSGVERFMPDWFEKVWLAWDRNHGLENLHPAQPAVFRRAVPHDEAACPEILRKALHETQEQ
jgi:GT2 family glycosyltransferase